MIAQQERMGMKYTGKRKNKGEKAPNAIHTNYWRISISRRGHPDDRALSTAEESWLFFCFFFFLPFGGACLPCHRGTCIIYRLTGIG